MKMRLMILAGLAAVTISTSAPTARAAEALVEAPTALEMRKGGFDWSGDKDEKPRKPRPKPGPRDEGDGD